MAKFKCTECNFKNEARAGLSAHMRFRHNLMLDGTQWRAAKKNKAELTETAVRAVRAYRKRNQDTQVAIRDTAFRVNGTANGGTGYSIQPPSNPIRHLETAAVEIQERLQVINRELENVKRLEVERSSLSYQLEQIELILNPVGSATQTPAQTVRELQHA